MGGFQLRLRVEAVRGDPHGWLRDVVAFLTIALGDLPYVAIWAAVVIDPGVLAHAFELDTEVKAVLATLGGHAPDDSRTRSAGAGPDRTGAREAAFEPFGPRDGAHDKSRGQCSLGDISAR